MKSEKALEGKFDSLRSAEKQYHQAEDWLLHELTEQHKLEALVRDPHCPQKRVYHLAELDGQECRVADARLQVNQTAVAYRAELANYHETANPHHPTTDEAFAVEHFFYRKARKRR